MIPTKKSTAEESDEGQRNAIQRARRYFLADAVYFLYDHNRVAEAAKWYRYLGGEFPNVTLLDRDTNSFPRNVTLDEYAVARVQGDIGDTSQERTTSDVQGLLARAYVALAIGQDDRYGGYRNLAKKIYDQYAAKTAAFNGNVRIPLPPYDELNHAVLNELLDPQQGLPYAARAVLRTQLGMSSETNAPPAAALSTNAPVPAAPAPTNTPATNSAGK